VFIFPIIIAFFGVLDKGEREGKCGGDIQKNVVGDDSIRSKKDVFLP